MGSARNWDFARQADAPELPPPGRSPGEARAYQHLKERLADRYGIELTWDNFDEVNRAANDGPFILDYQARHEDTDLRVFRYQGQNILAFYNTRNHHLNTVLPLSDLRWRGVPVELRPREAMAKTTRLEDQNWLLAHARDHGNGIKVFPGVTPATGDGLPPRGPLQASQPHVEAAEDALASQPPEARVTVVVPELRNTMTPPPDALSTTGRITPPTLTAQPAAAPQNTEPLPVPPASGPKTPAERLEQMEKLLSWAYFRSLKKGDVELSEAIRAVLMEGA
jgi:hypothetical protein